MQAIVVCERVFSLGAAPRYGRRRWHLLAMLGLATPAPSAAQSKLTNQTLFDTVSFLPEHYDKRVAQFAQEPTSSGAVIYLGDSITEGGAWSALTGDSTTLNRGIGGDITYGVLHRLDEVLRHRPSKLFILIGINDIAKDIPELVIADNCRQIVRRVQQASPSTRIFLQSVLPLSPSYAGFPQHYDKAGHVAALNPLLRRLAATAKITYVDLWPALADSHGRLDSRYTGDGLHLNRRGYERWIVRLTQVGAL